jgi:hypothetical protein
MDAKTRMERLVLRRAQLDARLSTARAQVSRQERRDETRRKIIAGAWAFKTLGEDWRRVGEKLRAASMLDARDSALFGLGDNQSVKQSDAKPPVVP